MRWLRVREYVFGPLARAPWLPRNLRGMAHRWAGGAVGQGVAFGPFVYVRDYTNLTVGPGSWIGPSCYFESHASVELGRDVNVGAHSVFAAASHEIGGSAKRAGHWFARPILVEDGVWIGASCTILPGSVIRRGSVVAAGSVVRGEVQADTLYAGVPAVPKRRLDD